MASKSTERTFAILLASLALSGVASAQQQRLPPNVITQPNMRLPPGAALDTSITTPELSFVGGAVTDRSDRAAPAVVIASDAELSFVGGAMTDTSDRAGPPQTITTSELSFIGR